MTTYAKTYLGKEQTFDTPYGNRSALRFTLETNSAGAVLESNDPAATALTTSDSVRLGILPAGARLLDCLAIVSGAFTTAATCKLGFEYTDGVDSTSVPQDADYFFAALALDAAGRTSANNTAVKPERLPKDAYLVLDLDTASLDEAGRVDFIIDMVMEGPA